MKVWTDDLIDTRKWREGLDTVERFTLQWPKKTTTANILLRNITCGILSFIYNELDIPSHKALNYVLYSNNFSELSCSNFWHTRQLGSIW